MPTRIETRQVGERTFEVIVAEINGAIAEIWPELGGNCVRWFHPHAGEVLFAPPIEDFVNRSTRGGIPILFPFPNRIRDGRFTWAGRDYQLPKNDSSGCNAIHGFTPRSKFQVHSHDGDSNSCFVWLECRGRDCLENVHSQWPADWHLNWYWILYPHRLDISVVLRNTDDRPLPFGMGLHPYFRLAGT